MTAFNLPPDVSLSDIDALFESADESQCQDVDLEVAASTLLTDEELKDIQELVNWSAIF